MFNSNLSGLIALFFTGIIAYTFVHFWKIQLWDKKLFFKIFYPKKLKIRTRFLFFFLLALLFYFDFIRDYIFHNLSYRMEFVDQMEQGKSSEIYGDQTDSWMVEILEGRSSNQIYLLKYVATGFFLCIYFIMTQSLLKLIYPKEYTLPFTTLLYGLGSLSMLLFFSLFFFEFSYETKYNFYLVAMEIGHFLESSLPTLLLLLSFKIYLVSKQDNPTE